MYNKEFDLEEKIVWESLAPSLQAKFVFTDYDYNLLRMIKNGKQDQILKVSVNNAETGMSGYLYADDNFHIIKSARTANDVAAMKAVPLSDQSVINDWYEIDSITYRESARNSTDFNFVNSGRYLQCGNGIHALVSTNIYPSAHEVYIKFVSAGSSSGYPAVIISAYKSQNGTYHDISVIRTGTKMQIVLDEFCSTSNRKVLAEKNTDSKSWSANSAVYMQIKRQYGRVEVSSSDMLPAIDKKIKQLYFLTYDMPAANNEGKFTPVQFKYAFKLFRDDKQIGVGVHDFPCQMYLLNGINTDVDDQIYYLTDNMSGDEVYMPEGNDWVTRADYFQAIPDRTFLFNPYTNQMYWFRNMGQFYELSVDGFHYTEAITGSSHTGELIKFDGKNNAYTAPGFLICYCVNDDDTLNMYKQDSSFTDYIYALHRDEMWQYGWYETINVENGDPYTVYHAEWVTKVSCTESLDGRTFLYNPDLQTFYFYYKGLNYVPIYAE